MVTNKTNDRANKDKLPLGGENPRNVKRNQGLIRRKKIEKFLLISCIILLTLFILNTVKSFIVSHTVDFQRSYVGSIDYTYETKGLLIYKEALVTSLADGRVEPSVAEWVMVKKEAKIATLVARATDGKSDEVKIKLLAADQGIISFQVDGLEGKYNPSDISNIDEEDLKVYMNSYKVLSTVMSKVKSGAVVAKTIDTKTNPLLFITVDKAVLGDVPKINDSMEVDMSASVRISGTVKQIMKKDSKYEILLSFNKPPDEVYRSRVSDVKVKLDTYSGTIVESRAIVKEGDLSYIYYSNRGIAYKKEVQIVGDVNKKVAIKGLDAGVYYITNPLFIKEGQILK